jgi:hypothetical protein
MVHLAIDATEEGQQRAEGAVDHLLRLRRIGAEADRGQQDHDITDTEPG